MYISACGLGPKLPENTKLWSQRTIVSHIQEGFVSLDMFVQSTYLFYSTEKEISYITKDIYDTIHS